MSTKKLSFLLIGVVLATAITTGCSKKRSAVAGAPVNQANQLQTGVRANVIKGLISSITESSGLVGWVCEENNSSTDLRIYAANNLTNLRATFSLEQSDSTALSQCAGVGVPFKFQVPFASLSNYTDMLIAVTAIPANSPQTSTPLTASNLYRVPA
ncbi:hypothetical protein EBT16_08890, partial [bacterium]|nr:hypothetical protein [bacterium]